MHPSQKRLDRMDRLTDMLHFPALVNFGATANILLTIAITWYIAPHYPMFVAPWLLIVLFLNLLPVILLRLTLTETTHYPTLTEMNFVHDQHKFSDWVYLAASANMAVWILLAWLAATLHRTAGTLLLLLAIAFLATFSPVLFRRKPSS